MLPSFDAEYARLHELAALPEHQAPRRRFRYALALERVPAALLGRLHAIEHATRKTAKGGDGAPLKGRVHLQSVVLRYLGALEAAGIEIASLTEETLVSVRHLEIYIERASDPNSASRVAASLYTLQSALRTLDVSASIAIILDRYGIAPARHNTDYLDYVPLSERLHLERALARPARARRLGEPGALAPSIVPKIKRSLGSFWRCFADDPLLAGKPLAALDLGAALWCFEERMVASSDATLIGRLTEIKAALDRIGFESGADVTWRIAERIRELKRNRLHEPVEIPEGIGPRDIERLGRKLVRDAHARLRGLLAARHAYRDTLRLAEQYRDGLIIILFSLIVLRVSNMAILMLEQSIRRKGNCWMIAIEARFTKNDKPIFQSLPPWVGAMLDHYHDVVRPLIAPIRKGVNDKVFWIARHSEALRPGAFQDIVPRRCLDGFQVRIWCHLLRAIEASDSLESMPEDPGYASVALRQRSGAVTRRHYQSARAIERAPASLPGVKGNDAALPTIVPGIIAIGPAAHRSPRSTVSNLRED